MEGTICFDNKEKWSFEKEYGFNPPRPLGARVCIEQYVKSEESGAGIKLAKSEMSKRLDVADCIVGRVVKIGSACFKSEDFKHWDKADLPEVGDWVTFKITPGWKKYGPPGKGVCVITMFDDAINEKIEDPSYVSRDL